MEENKSENFERMIQSVIITLNDGRKLTFTGRAFFNKDMTDELVITDIKFTEPISLPEGYSISTISEIKENETE